MAKYKRSDFYAIKKHGKLIGLDQEWQYYLYKDAVYYVHSSGDLDRIGIWCSVSKLRSHLQHLQNITHERWEKTIVLIHPELIPNY